MCNSLPLLRRVLFSPTPLCPTVIWATLQMLRFTYFIHTEAQWLYSSYTYYQNQQYEHVGVFIYIIDVTVSIYRYSVDCVCVWVWVDGFMPSIRVLLQLKIATSIRVRRAWLVTIETAVYLCSCVRCAGVPGSLDSQWSWGLSSCLIPPALNLSFEMRKRQESRE